MDKRTLRILEFDKIVDKVSALCSSVLGRELAEELEPQTEYGKVQRLLKETSDAASYVIRRGSPPMGGIHDIRPVLKRVEMGSVLGPGELLAVADTLRTARGLKNYSSSAVTDDGENIAGSLINALETSKRIEDKINLAIVSEEEIADNASTTLSNIRRQIKDQQASIKDKLSDMIRSAKYQKFMQESLVTMRGDRYVVPVKQEYRSEVPGLVHDSSSSGATIFVEPMSVVEANNSIKQLKIKEQLEIERILHELTADVDSILPQLNSNITILAKLDFIFAKAKLSLDYNCVCPALNDQKRIIIKKGRHPLIDKKVVVPTNFWIGKDFNTLVITGPNTGGKTVTLKTVGLFTVMAQAGLHLPANEGTEVCVFKKIYADIGDEQSIEQSLSTFSSHMTNIVRILAGADDESLALFDELGAGTDPTEGAALAMSILEKLHQIGTITVATTHYSELKVYALTTKGIENACCEFDVQTLRPTYNLLIGVPGKSNAFAISKRLGLSGEILDRAKEFLSKEEIEFEDILLTIEKNRAESEKERSIAASYRIQIENMKKQLEEQNQRFTSQKEKLMREAKEDARKLLIQAREEAEAMMQEMKFALEEQETAARNKAAEEVRKKLRTKISDIEESMSVSLMPRVSYSKPPDNLKPGDDVQIISLNQKGTVITPPDRNGEAIIQAGIMKINVHISNLRFIDGQLHEAAKSGSGKIGVSKAMSITTQIDIRGKNVDESIEVIDKFLDDAVMAGLSEVMIIHGKGTGALRSGIHSYLKANGRVKTFRLGKYGEGEAGVTVAELK